MEYILNEPMGWLVLPVITYLVQTVQQAGAARLGWEKHHVQICPTNISQPCSNLALKSLVAIGIISSSPVCSSLPLEEDE